ncbi:uncharacterized protein LOC135170925 isoform X2 [Diachasmimorpha longicaudata]|uniref:uncharacterized protein LOC135170925 isoform X2 n=1 Tax=Diachasmimorpha longicaudata TaxID=58733 RepID=UPI0030B8914C
MTIWRPKNLYEALVPAYIVRAILGFAMIRYPMDKPRVKLTIIHSIVVFTTYGYFFVTIFLSHWNSIEMQNRPKVTYILVVMYNICMIFMIISAWINQKMDQETLLMSSELEHRLDALGIKCNYQQIVILQLSVIFVWCVMTLALNLSSSIWAIGHFPTFCYFLECSCLAHAININSLMELSYFMAIRHITRRYQDINEFLENMELSSADGQLGTEYRLRGHQTGSYRVHVGSFLTRKKIMRSLHNLKHVHLELRKLTQRVTRSHATQLIFLMLSSFFLITWMLYVMYNTIMITEVATSVKWIRGCTGGVVVVSIGLKLVSVNCICATAEYEYERTRAILQKLVMNVRDRELQREVISRTHPERKI